MGGYGSGRTSKVGRRHRKKERLENCPFINSFKLLPNKIAKQSGVGRTSVGPYHIEVSKEVIRIHKIGEKIQFTAAMLPVSNQKGTRYYFPCPVCNNRTSRLYFQETIACRLCHRLSYHSQNIANEDRWLLKRDRLLQRYNISFEDANNSIRKRGMHKKTFEKFMAEYNFINDMGINIHLNRFDYKRVLLLLKAGKVNGRFDISYGEAVYSRFL